jgi:hypothetical protein
LVGRVAVQVAQAEAYCTPQADQVRRQSSSSS